MAIAYVRDTGAQSGSDIDSDSASFASLPAAGNSVFVLVSKWVGATDPFSASDVSDNQSNSYAIDVSKEEVAFDNVNIGIFSDIDIGTPSGTFTITIDPVGIHHYIEWIGVEFSGLADASALDQVNSAEGTSTTPTVTSGTTTQADELVLGCLGATTTSGSAGIDLPGGYTQLHLHNTADDTVAHLSAYKIVSATGTQTFDGGTLVAGPCHWAIGVATYKATGGAADNVYQAQIGVTLQAMNRGATF